MHICDTNMKIRLAAFHFVCTYKSFNSETNGCQTLRRRLPVFWSFATANMVNKKHKTIWVNIMHKLHKC